MSDLTSLCVCTYEKTHHLTNVFQSLARHSSPPYEIIVVDDSSKNPQVVKLLSMFQKKFKEMGVDFKIYVNAVNMGHAASQNKAWELANGNTLFHIEDDIVVPVDSWNQKFAKALKDHPEVGQFLPEGSGRGEWIPRGPYNEFAWGLGGLFAVRKEVFHKIGGWREFLRHQIEPEFNLRVRMAGWRVAELKGVQMVHLGEGENHETFKRQAQIIIGVHTMLMMWNKRFMGFWDYDSLWSMSWDDFPPNVAFRRQLAAWFAAEAEKLEDRYRGLGDLKNDPHYANAVPEDIRRVHADLKRCVLNPQKRPWKFPSHWGAYELVNVIRPQGREREPELINLMKNNHVFKDHDRLEQQLRDLAKRMDYDLSEDELQGMLKDAPTDIRWDAVPVYGRWS